MILVKQYPSFHIAWLYRILYCKSIDEFFYTQGMFRSLDYDLNASVYAKGGIITIEILFYGETVKQKANKLKNLSVDIDEVSIGAGIGQIVAERQKPFYTPGVREIAEELKELHDQPWVDIDQLSSINTKSIEMKQGSLTLAAGPVQRTRSLIVDISLHPDMVTSHPELLPLFTCIATFIHCNCENIISNAFGLYGVGIKKDVRYEDDFGMPLVFRVPPSGKDLMNDTDRLKKILQLFVDWFEEFQDNKTIARFLGNLKYADYKDYRDLMPSPRATLHDTGIFVGTKGWRKIATVENCNLLLENTSIHVKYGRKKISLPAIEGAKR